MVKRPVSYRVALRCEAMRSDASQEDEEEAKKSTRVRRLNVVKFAA